MAPEVGTWHKLKVILQGLPSAFGWKIHIQENGSDQKWSEMVKTASYTSLKIFAELNLMEILKTPKCTPDAKY